MKFKEFQKIPRLNRDVIITEKLDGTNGQICIHDLSDIDKVDLDPEMIEFIKLYCLYQRDTLYLFAGSRNRWLTLKDDNYGFARWVTNNADELLKLGEGFHYGEWWGNGIQRGYGATEKRFSLFNVHKWSDDVVRPKCCSVVPKLYEGLFDTSMVDKILNDLKEHGSYAIPFMNPEGIIIFHKPSGYMFKKTILNDQQPKGQSNDN